MTSSKRHIKNITASVLLALFAFMHAAKALHIHADNHNVQKGMVVISSTKSSCDICDYQAAKEPCLVASEIEYTNPVFFTEEYCAHPRAALSKNNLSHTSRGPPCFI